MVIRFQLTFPGKVAVSCFLIVLIIYYKSSDSARPQPSHLLVAGMVSLRESTPQPAVPVPNPSCPHGFYTKEELKPHLQRPIQNPKAPGANGKRFVSQQMTSEENKENARGFHKNKFSQFASDRISLHRDLGEDTRSPECLAQKFWHCPGLPTTSVIIVFHNEAWSALLRTVYSVLHTAPAALLTEVLLVDDASTDEHLGTRLDNYVRQLNIVRVLRQRERKGLVAARLMGAQAAKGEVLTFLDSHCECFPGWLEPLLARIAEKPTAVVSPRIVTIDQDNLKFSKPLPNKHSQIRGNFDWSLKFGWEVIPAEERKGRNDETRPIRTPTFAGGLFSVSKSYFEHIGTYDDQMEFWGGENLEMSFRVWQCGGQLEIIPCSVVGHIFRRNTPHSFPNGGSVITRNLVRLAEVWMDDFKYVFYRANRKAASIFQENSFGDVTERHRLRKRLKCRSFSWYLKTIYPEVYMPDISPVKYGQLKNNGWKCFLDVTKTKRHWESGQKFGCRNGVGAQYFEYTSQQEVRLSSSNRMCLHATPGRDLVSLQFCRLKGKLNMAAPEQVWLYTQTHGLRNLLSDKCLTVSEGNVTATTCSPTSLNQNWVFI